MPVDLAYKRAPITRAGESMTDDELRDEYLTLISDLNSQCSNRYIYATPGRDEIVVNRTLGIVGAFLAYEPKSKYRPRKTGKGRD